MHAQVRVHVLSATGLPKMDANGKADPYVVLACGKGTEQRSSVVHKSLSPVWDDARFEFSEVESSEELLLTMFDKDRYEPCQMYSIAVQTQYMYCTFEFDKDRGSRSDPMGVVRVPLSEMDGQERAYALQVRVPISYLV